jgi:glycerophosphoryl diester phosphodiesterase
MIGQTLIVGHRGSSRRAPENTLGSFRLAFEEGADGIECDFRLTADGEIVCLHDERTGRTGDRDLVVAGSTLEELRRADLGSWKGEAWRGERIATLSEVLRVIPQGKLLFVELKCGPEILPRLAAVLADSAPDPKQIRLLSFSWELIARCKELLPGTRACWLTDYRLRAGWHPSPAEVLATLKRCRADGLASRSRAILDRAFVAALRERGHELHVWTVDRAAEAGRLCELGVDSIMTNRPGWLQKALADTR